MNADIIDLLGYLMQHFPNKLYLIHSSHKLFYSKNTNSYTVVKVGALSEKTIHQGDDIRVALDVFTENLSLP